MTHYRRVQTATLRFASVAAIAIGAAAALTAGAIQVGGGDALVRQAWTSFAGVMPCAVPEAAAIVADAPEAMGDAEGIARVRGLYCYAARLLPPAILEALAGAPIFQSGPHRDGKLHLQTYRFGHYNAAFVKWGAEHLIPASTDAAFHTQTQAIYDRNFRDLARTYAAANRYFEKHSGELTRIAREYQSAVAAAGPDPDDAHPFDPAKNPARRLSDALVPAGICIASAPDAAAGTSGIDARAAAEAAAFWVRRSLDGTRGEFSAALAALMKTYDPEFTPAGCDFR